MVESSYLRLRGERFETKPKRIILAENFKDWPGQLSDAEIGARFNQISDCLVKGNLVPPSFYRRGIERTSDELLEDEGIKHVHLDTGGGDALLFLVEYDDAVVFLEINSHVHFETEPVGSVLRSLHANCLKREDEEAESRKNERTRRRFEIFRGGLKPRSKR